MGKKIEWPSKDEVYDLYILKNVSREDCAKAFNITERLFKKIISVYQIKKDSKKAYENYTKTCINKYGVDNIFKLDETIKKAHLPEVEEKRKQSNKETCLKRYGQVHSVTNEVKDKIKSTMQERYKVDSYLEICRDKSKLPEVRAIATANTIKTNQIKYGVDYWWQSDDYKNRFRSPEQVKQYKIK